MTMASKTSKATVAAILSELCPSPDDQQGLSDFFTDYFGTADAEELGKPLIKLKAYKIHGHNEY